MSLYTTYTYNTTALQNGISHIVLSYNNVSTIIQSAYYNITRINNQDSLEYIINIQITKDHQIIQCQNNCQPNFFSLLIYGSSIAPTLSIKIDFNISNTNLFYDYVKNLFIEIRIILRYNRTALGDENIIITIAQSYWDNKYLDYRYKRKYANFSNILGKNVVSLVANKTILENKPRYTSSISDCVNNWDSVPFLAVQDKTFVHNHDSSISDKVVKTHRNKYTASFRFSGVTDKDIARLYDFIEDTNNNFPFGNVQNGETEPRKLVYYPIDDNDYLMVFHASYMALTRTGVHKLFEGNWLVHLYSTSDLMDLEGAELELSNRRYISITPKIYVNISSRRTNNRLDIFLNFILQVPNGSFIQYGGRTPTNNAVTLENFNLSNEVLVLIPIDVYMLLVGRTSLSTLNEPGSYGSPNLQVVYEAAILNGSMNETFELISFNDLLNPNYQVSSNLQPYRIKLEQIYLPHNIMKLSSGNTSFGANVIAASKYEVLITGGRIRIITIERRSDLFLFPFYKILYHSKNTSNNPNQPFWMRPRYELFYRYFIQ